MDSVFAPEKYFERNEKNEELYQYVNSHIDEAIEKKWIQVYYQPVIRTLTGNLSSLEALARWKDPVHGFLSPCDFVSALEESSLIYKLDLAVIREVAETISQQYHAGSPYLVPVSVNLSRRDFVYCDVFREIEAIRIQAEIPRDLLYIEITETTLVQNKDLLQKKLEQFHKAGYQIWMDDFGSGYSSLNVLGEYHFDMIKFDMEFLRSFTPTAREILRSSVSMAKRLHIRTLAEGVETPEHVQFLREIGCDRLQGFYYSRPLPQQELYEVLEKNKIKAEDLHWQQYYDCADPYTLDTDRAVAVLEGKEADFHVHYLFASKDQIRQLQSLGRRSMEESEHFINEEGYTIHRKYQSMIQRCLESAKGQTTYYSVTGNTIRLEAEIAARYEGRFLLIVSMINISDDPEQEAQKQIEAELKDISLIFDDVHVFYPDENRAEPLLSTLDFKYNTMESIENLSGSLAAYGRTYIHPDDLERYREHCRFSTMKERLHKSGRGYICDYFRTRQNDGSYEWMEYNLLEIPESSRYALLSCVKNATPAGEEDFEDILKGMKTKESP